MESLSKSDAVAALRAAADLIERLPFDRWCYVAAEMFNLTAAEMAAAAQSGGKWEKDTGGINESLFVLRQGIVELYADRDEVCKAVPTGRTTIVKRVVTPAVLEDVAVPEVEWVCEPLLAKAEG
jgi:hypothetical protein